MAHTNAQTDPDQQQRQQQQPTPHLMLSLSFRGTQLPPIPLTAATTCGQLAQLVQQHLDKPLALHTLKLLPRGGGAAAAVTLLAAPDALLLDTGVVVQQQPGSCACLLLGSYQAELQAVQSSQAAEQSLRMPDFDYEARRAAARSTAAAGGGAGTGKNHFGSFRVLPPSPLAPPGAPPPSAALSLLHKLATDPAIASVMQTHGWMVPLLSEMPPEGLVGVSAVCILGVNHNRGQEIQLRLRTDDYAGFRKYNSIRTTLVHELTHNVWGDHDNNFKQLNNQLLKEVAAYEAAHGSAAGRTAGGIDAAYDPTAAQRQQQQQQQQQQAPARGKTTVDGQQQLLFHQALQRVLPAPALARAAALARWQEQSPQQQQQRAMLDAGGAVPAAAMDSAAGDAGVAADDDRMLQQYEHDDPLTAAAEAAAERLGSLDVAAGAEEAGTEHGAAAADMLQPGSSTQLLQQQQQQALAQQAQPCPNDALCRDEHMQAAAVPQQVDTEGAAACTCACSTTSSSTRDDVRADEGAASPPASSSAAAAAGAGAAEGGSTQGTSAPEVTQAGGDGDDAASLAASLDPVVASKLQQAGRLVQQLRQQSPPALLTLAEVLRNLAASPQEPRFRRLRVSNAAFHRKLGQFEAAQQLLQLAGFVLRQEAAVSGGGSGGSGATEPVLVYTRNDPGLVYLVSQVVSSQAAGE